MVNIDMNINLDKHENAQCFDNLRRYIKEFLMTTSAYLTVIKETVLQLWRYVEFRILVCILCVPLTIFVVFCTCLGCFTVFVSASIWLLFSTIALIALFPFLIGSMGVAIGLVLAYQVCVLTKVYLASISNFAVANDENDDDLVICDDKK